MRASSPGRTAILRAGVFLTLLASWPLAPPDAPASCGDYVTSRAQREAHSGARMTPFAPGSFPVSGLMAAHPLNDRLPCTGPTCSRPPTVPDAPAPSIPPPVEPWCDTSWISLCAGPEPVADLHDSPLDRPSRRASALKRPPRARPA